MKNHSKSVFYGKSWKPGLVGLMMLIGICSCNNKGAISASSTSEDTTETSTTEVADSKEGLKLKNFTKEAPTFGGEKSSIDCDYPVAGNPTLVQNIREWINDRLGGSYEGDLNNAEAMFNFYAKNLSEDEEGMQVLSVTEIKKVYENTKIVTFTCSGYTCLEGAAHGVGGEIGATFRKSDGKLFTADMVPSVYNQEMQAFIKKGLKEYFEITSDSELKEYLIDVNNLNEIPLPSTDPWITEKGVNFSYMPYEIASYAAGQPSFVVPTKDIKKNTNTAGKTFFE